MEISSSEINLIATVGVPLIFGVIDRLRQRGGAEPTLEEVQAELLADETAIRNEAAGFYARHKELTGE